MKNLAVRLTLLGLFVAACGVAAYLVWTSEARARRDAEDSRRFETVALDLERGILELRAAQLAYVAAGQGDQFWVARVGGIAARLKSGLDTLRARSVSPRAQSAVDTASSAMQDFEQMDRRARDYARTAQRLLASDLIFADGLEITGAMLSAIEQARIAEAEVREASKLEVQRAEAFALVGFAAVSSCVILLLLPVPHVSSDGTGRQAAPDAVRADPESAPIGDLPLAAVPAPPAPAPMPFELDAVASLCSDLARVSDTRALPSLLERAAAILDAPGIVLWIADPDGRELNPIVTHGYAPQMVSRLGTIPRDAANVTAAAFRTSLLQTVAADAVSNGAIAAPLVTPAGSVGVMAAEVNRHGEQDAAKLAAASIVAAQLATLVGPPSTRAQARADVG